MRILFLSTWFPYPPVHGGKIRAFNLLKALSERHQVTLVSFEDTPVEDHWLEELQKYCVRVEVVKQDPFHKPHLGKLAGWFSFLPSDVVASYSRKMEEVVTQIAEEWKPDAVVALTFVTARYALKVRNAVRIVDVDNLMTGMMQDSLQQARGGKNWLRRSLALWKFARYERWLYRHFDLCMVVTESDRKKIVDLFHIPVEKSGVIPNGAPVEAFDGRIQTPRNGNLIFNGALTYHANFDAMEFFLKEIFPAISRIVPGVSIKITGSTKGVPVHLLPTIDGVELTGFLPDIKPVISNSTVCVVPLRIGGGTRIKILEAMALGTPVVSTPKGAEGLEVTDGIHLLLADTPEDFAQKTVQLLRDESLRRQISSNARQLIAEKYSWSNIQRHFCALTETIVANNKRN